MRRDEMRNQDIHELFNKAGVKNIHLGPTLPGFLSPNVAKVLVEKFGIAGIGKVDDDIELFMA